MKKAIQGAANQDPDPKGSVKPGETPGAVSSGNTSTTKAPTASTIGAVEAKATEAPSTGSLLKIVLVSLLLGSSIITPGLVLYLKNSAEFTFRLLPLILVLGSSWIIISGLALALQYPLRQKKYFAWIHAGLLALGLTIYLQSAFFTFVFSADAEDAVAPDSGMGWLALLDFVLLAAPVVLALIYRKPICHSSVKLTLIILLSQLSPLAWELTVFQPTNYDFYDNAVDSTAKFTFGSKENIFLVMVDAMSEVSLKKALNFSPQLAESLKDFSCFDRLESPIPHTRFAVPSMISGQEFPAGLPLDDDQAHLAYLRTSSIGPDSLIPNLKKQGYRLEGYPFLLQTINYNPRFWDNVVARLSNSRSTDQFIDVWLYQVTPFALKYLFARQYLSFRDHFVTPSSEQTVFPGETHDMIFLRRLRATAKKGPYPKVFKYYHLQGTHSPYTINENAEKTLDTDEVRQLCGSMRNVELLLEKLKRFELYDNALIVITGDHTELYTPETIMMIKRPGDTQKEITFHSQPCKVRDIATTILAEKGFRPADQSVFSHDMKPANCVRHLPERPVVAFSAPRPAPRVSFGFNPYDTLSMSFQLNGPDLVIDDHDVEPSEHFSVDFLVENIADGKLYMTSTKEVRDLQSPLYYRVPLTGLPDGEYRIYRHIFNREGESSIYSCLPRFVQIRNDRIALQPKPDYAPPPQPIKADAPVSFGLMTLCPSVKFSADAKLLESSLQFTPNSVITVLLPPSAKPQKLDITLMVNADSPVNEVKVYQGKEMIARQKTNRIALLTIPVTVPPNLPEVNLSFKPQTAPDAKVKLRLKEIKLVE